MGVFVRSEGNRRSLHCATPDFLLILVALANTLRLSLLKAAHAVVSNAAWQEIRVRSGRDDKFAEPDTAVHRLEIGHLPSRPEESWACGASNVMKNASVQQPLAIKPSPFPLSSRAKPRDLQFRRPFWKSGISPRNKFVISTGAKRSGETCGFLSFSRRRQNLAALLFHDPVLEAWR
jgi:hypothetical protein